MKWKQKGFMKEKEYMLEARMKKLYKQFFGNSWRKKKKEENRFEKTDLRIGGRIIKKRRERRNLVFEKPKSI